MHFFVQKRQKVQIFFTFARKINIFSKIIYFFAQKKCHVTSRDVLFVHASFEKDNFCCIFALAFGKSCSQMSLGDIKRTIAFALPKTNLRLLSGTPF